MPKTMDIEWAKQYRTAQVYGSGAEGALVNAKGQQIGPWVTCRDFYNDARRAEINETSCEVHGYIYDWGDSPVIGNTRARLLIANEEDSELKKRLKNIKAFVNAIEVSLGITPLTFYRLCNNPPSNYAECGVSYWVGSKDWVISPPVFSAWTFLLRNGRNYEIGTPWEDVFKDLTNNCAMAGCSNDSEYSEFVLAALKFWQQEGLLNCFFPKLEDNYPKKMDDYDFHHHTGVCSYAYGDKIVKGWKYPDADLPATDWLHA